MHIILYASGKRVNAWSVHRHLADKWANTYVQPHTKRRLMPATTTEIATIEHLILLDLLGAPHPVIRSSFVDTAWLFDAMVSAETRLAQAGAFVYGNDGEKTLEDWGSFFVPHNRPNVFMGPIEDDHVPFLKRGVSVLHVIASPFPSVWHKIQASASVYSR